MSETSKPILAVALNPALDLTITCDRVVLDAVNIARSGNIRAAGKAINVAKVLTDLGQQVSVTGILGQNNREKFDDFFKAQLIADKCLHVEGETRINVKVTEKNNQVTEINLPGLQLNPGHIEKFKQRLTSISRKSNWVILSGSLPKGAPQNLYYHLIKILKQQGNRVVVDTSGQAFREAIKAAPFMIKPNIYELEQWYGHTINNLQEEAAAASRLLALNIDNVVISEGRKGCRWYTRNQVWQAFPPAVEQVSTVGSGDSLVAGIVYGLSCGWTVEATLKLATAIAAKAVAQVGVGISDISSLSALRQQVHTEQLTACV
ncbi:MAG: 1-phosphofructokinase [Cytophagales bacterium]|nr:1-phosphofructokinase [Cytophagales bacterium]